MSKTNSATNKRVAAEGRAMIRSNRETVAAHLEDIVARPMRCRVTVHDMGEDHDPCETCCVHGEDVMPGCRG